jgi:hypothetical protein
MNMSKRTIISFIVLTLSASGFLSWHLFGKDALDPQSGSASLLTKFSTPGPSIASNIGLRDLLIPLSKTPATSLIVNKDSNEVFYYEKATGKVFAVGFDGRRERVISETVLPYFNRTEWSPNLKEVISTFVNRTSTTLRHFSYSSKKVTSLPSSAQQAVFSPDGSQIGYLLTEGEQSGIYIGTLQNKRKILSTRSNIKYLQWPQADYLSLIIGSEDGTAALFTLNLNGELTRVTDFVLDLRIRWSRDGSRVLISFYDAEGTLQLMQYSVAREMESAIAPGIRADECAWSIDGETLVCGVDDSTPFEPGDITSQRIERISLNPVERATIMPSNARKVTVKEILLSPLENYVLFINSFDQKVYSLRSG